jgi:dolichol kinase
VTRGLARRVVHTGLAGGALLLPLFPWGASVLALTAAACFNAAILAPRAWLARVDGRGSRGLVLYPLVLAILLLYYQEDVVPVQCAWFAMAVGDGLAPLFRHGGAPWPWRRDKEMSATFLAYGLSAVLMVSVVPWPVALAAALAGAVAETLPEPLDDNLCVPIAAAGAAHFARGMAWSG